MKRIIPVLFPLLHVEPSSAGVQFLLVSPDVLAFVVESTQLERSKPKTESRTNLLQARVGFVGVLPVRIHDVTMPTEEDEISLVVEGHCLASSEVGLLGE